MKYLIWISALMLAVMAGLCARSLAQSIVVTACVAGAYVLGALRVQLMIKEIYKQLR